MTRWLEMSYSKVVAILNITDYELISDELTRLNVPGISLSKVQGFGDYVNEYSPNGFSNSMKIEIYTHAEQAGEIARVLSVLAEDITDGGGVVAVEPVAELFNVRKLKSE
jgi:nitrogen regulatory protein P-II 1